MDYTSHQEMRQSASDQTDDERTDAEIITSRPKSRWVMVFLSGLGALVSLDWGLPVIFGHGNVLPLMVTFQIGLWLCVAYSWYDYRYGWNLPAISFIIAWVVSDTFAMLVPALIAANR